jgi:hypothetical protein
LVSTAVNSGAIWPTSTAAFALGKQAAKPIAVSMDKIFVFMFFPLFLKS